MKLKYILILLGVSHILIAQNTSDKMILDGLKSYEEGNFKKAEKLFSLSLKENPGLVDVYFYRGNTFYALEEFNKAINDYSKALELDPGNLEFLYNRGSSFYEQDEYNKAITDFDQVLKKKTFIRRSFA